MQLRAIVLITFAAATVVKAGKKHQENDDANVGYKFGYAVHDPHTHDIKAHHEERHGKHVVGYYSLKQPDGTTRVVHYKAGPHSGFEAIVEIIGHPHDGDHHGHETRKVQVHGNNDGNKNHEGNEHQRSHESHGGHGHLQIQGKHAGHASQRIIHGSQNGYKGQSNHGGHGGQSGHEHQGHGSHNNYESYGGQQSHGNPKNQGNNNNNHRYWVHEDDDDSNHLENIIYGGYGDDNDEYEY